MSRQSYLIVGVILVVRRTAALPWPWISHTENETVVDIGSVSVTAGTKKSIPLPPILGGISLAGGVGLIVAGTRKGRLP
jgi:hypothetical protein